MLVMSSAVKSALSETLKQVERIARRPEHTFLDRGYRGHDYKGDINIHVDKVRRGRTPKAYGAEGKEGDRINTILSAAGMNFRKLIKWLEAFLCPFYFSLLLHLKIRWRTEIAAF